LPPTHNIVVLDEVGNAHLEAKQSQNNVNRWYCCCSAEQERSRRC
jgi:hypothetical protein